MNTDFLYKLTHKMKGGSPGILAAVAIAGVGTTAYLSAKAAITAQGLLSEDEVMNGRIVDRNERLKHQGKIVWKCYIPPAASGVVTVGSIVMSTRINSRRAAAAQAALMLSDRAYSEYRAKVVEEYGEKKDKAIRDQIVEDNVRRNPPSEVIISGVGQVLCCEVHTGRYFNSDIETLRKNVNRVNARMLQHDHVTLDEWYDMVGLQGTSYSSDMGWHVDRLLELEFTSMMTEDERPCLAFEYNYVRPVYEGLFG